MRSERGQALVEFSVAFIVFATMLFAVVDFGRGIYAFNGVSQAAREIARVASVHPGTTLGVSTEVAAVVATQKGLVPGLGTPTFTCVDSAGAPASPCNYATDSVKVVVTAPFRGVTPAVSIFGQFTLQGTSSVQIQ